MPLNIRIALWLTHFLCPEIGARQPSPKKPTPRSAPRSKAPDFVDDVEYDLVAEWAEYAARQESTRHHLFRCLNK
jgi:hypothetical protein